MGIVGGIVSKSFRQCLSSGQTYNLAVEKVLANHHGVDGLGILKGQEGKAPRAPSLAVSHDQAVRHIAELGKVPFERLCRQRVSRHCRSKTRLCDVPSVVSQLRPPTNIFLSS